MNAIIIGAGSGKRISENVKNIPKSLVKINGKSILEYQIAILKKAGIENIIIITGPHSEKFQFTDVNFVNPNFLLFNHLSFSGSWSLTFLRIIPKNRIKIFICLVNAILFCLSENSFSGSKLATLKRFPE